MEDSADKIEAAITALQAQRLKPVTVLFMDVVGSTDLSQRLDPEDVHAVMDGALAHLTAVVEAQQGRVLQYAGDSLLAVFGADQALEDDAERAVRAGLAILAEAAPLATRVRAEHRFEGFGLRVGLNTGPVLLGGGVDAEAASAASPSTSPRAWSRPRRPARCASATTPTAMCAGCSRSRRGSRSRSRASPSRCAATSCCGRARERSGSRTAGSTASRPAWSGATPSWRA